MIKNISNGKSVIGAVFQQTLNIRKFYHIFRRAKTLGINKNDETKLQIVAVRAENSKAEKKENSSQDFIKNSTSKLILQSLLFKSEYLVSKIMLTKQKTKW